MAQEIREETRRLVAALARMPRLAVILVGDDPASRLYVSLKEKSAEESGIAFEKTLFPADVLAEKLLKAIELLNRRDDVDAILVQIPLPAQLDEETVIAAIDPAKDADGFHPANLDALRSGETDRLPGITEGILRLADASGRALRGAHALILANSDVFAFPLAHALLGRGMQVEILLPPLDPDAIAAIAMKSSLIVSAVGAPGTVHAGMVADGAVVIDVGTTRLPGGKVAGDVAAADFEARDVSLTPVPGGVGPVTVAMLLRRVAEIAKRRQG